MKMEDFTNFTAKCFNGEPASCSFACTFHMNIRSFLDKAGKGRWTAAYKELANSVVFPVVVSALCHQPCRERCQRTATGDEPIAMRDIESAVIRYAKNRVPDAYYIPQKTQSVAVIGAGVAGLSCALNLARKKYAVTVFEKEEGWGGSLRKHPRFAEFDEEFTQLFSNAEVTFKYGNEVKALDGLNGFDAVYVSTGGGGESFGLRDGWDPNLLTTPNPKVFMGGALCGASIMEGIAQGLRLSKIMESFLQTGRAADPGDGYDKDYCGHFLKHEGVASSPLIRPSSEDGYMEAEAKSEAARCLQCDCELCINACEMLKKFNKKPHRIAVEAFTDMQASTLSGRRLLRETYSCNICGYCKSVCPESVDLGDLLQFSRTARRKDGSYPPAFHDYWLREMDFNTSDGFFAAAPKGRKECEYAFFPGCQLGASNPEYVYKAYGFLKDKYDAGLILDCCGAPAYWAGDDERLFVNAEKIRKHWDAMGKPALVFACATCESVFYKFLPEIKRVSLYELLAASLEIKTGARYKAAAVFDPCNAREDHGMEDGVRKLAQKAGVKLSELPEKNRCCGYGGHIRVANPKLYDEIANKRSSAGDAPYIVYCANCLEVFRSLGKDCTHILDLAFGLDAVRKLPAIHEKRENSREVKKRLMKEITGADFEPACAEWDGLKLAVGEEIRKDLERKLIAESDIKEAIWFAEKDGDKFNDENDGTNLCSMVKNVLTYWVHYRELSPGIYEILSAYTHRMRFGKEG